MALDDNICEQIKELYIGTKLTDALETFDNIPIRIVVELISIVQRFRNLTKLHLIVSGIDRFNTKYLFEKCTKLVNLGIWCSGKKSSDELFEHILDNCLQIGTIRLFGCGIYEESVRRIRQMFQWNAPFQIVFSILYSKRT